MSVTLATLRQRVCREVGSWKEVTTTSAGDADFTTLVSTAFADYPDSSLKDKYVKVTSGTTKETRKIEDNQSPTGTIKVYRPFSAQIATAMTVELHDFDPDNFTSFINKAVRDAYPELCKSVVDTTLVAGNILVNSNFEDWAATTYPDYWRTSVSTLTQESSYVRHGTYSMKAVNAGYAYLSSLQWLPLLDLENSSIDVYAWCKASVASAASLQVYTKTQAGTEVTTGGTGDSLHSGAGEWEFLELESVSVPDDLAEIQIRCVVAGANTVYFDNCYLLATTYDYLKPSGIDKILQVNLANDCNELRTHSLQRLDWQEIDKTGMKYIRIDDYIAGRKFELTGYTTFTDLSADTDTIAISAPWQRAVVVGTTCNLLRSQGTTISSQDIKEVVALADKYQAEFEALKARNAMVVAPMQIKKWS